MATGAAGAAARAVGWAVMRSSSCFTNELFGPVLIGDLKYRAVMALISPIVRALTSPPWALSFATADVALSMRAAAASELLADLLTALRAGPPFSWGVTPSGGPPGGRSLSKDGTRADSAKDFCCV